MEKWLVQILAQALRLASPAVVKNCRESVEKMVEHAATTENPWDDILAWILQMIVGKPGAATQPSDEGGS